MSRRKKPLSARLNSRNSRLWCELDVGSMRVRCHLADRAARSLPELHDGRVGWFDADTQTILIGWDVADDLAESTLLHETVHAVVFAFGVRLRGGEETSDEQEEAVVNPLAGGLYEVLRRNAMLLIPPRPKLPKCASPRVPS